MTDLIADSSYQLARRRFMADSWHKAGKAAEVGTVVDPGNERLWRIRIHAAHAAGRPDRANEAVERMRARISELGFDLEPETIELVEAIQRHDNQGIEHALKAL